MTKLCNKCREEIPAGRLKALPGATTCVACSSSKMKRAVTITAGAGEDTYNDIIIIEADDFEKAFSKQIRNTSPFQDDMDTDQA